MNLNFAVQRVADVLPWRLAKRVRRVFPVTYGHYSVVNNDPVIILIQEDFYDDPAPWRFFFDALKKKKVYFLCYVLGQIEAHRASYQRGVRAMLAEHRLHYPLHHFIFLANNQSQKNLYDDVNVPAVLVNHNVYVDQTLFSILPNTSKKYDAVYNAVMMPYKRHHLASCIENLALITYLKPGYDDYFEMLAREMSHAHWLNFGSHLLNRDQYTMLPKHEVSRFLNEARVGLCLSEEEGAMFASMEYLLCGLPIISTPSVGGRDVFFDSEYAIIVDPDPIAVRDAVHELITRDISPHEVRGKTISRVEEQRTTLIELVVRLCEEEGRQVDRSELYERVFSADSYRLRELHRVGQWIAG